MQSNASDSMLVTVAELTCSGNKVLSTLSQKVPRFHRDIHDWCCMNTIYNSKIYFWKTFLPITVSGILRRVNFTVLPPYSAVLFAKTVSPFKTTLLPLT